MDEFIAFSLSIHQARKSRAGNAFENHLEYLFQQYGLYYSRNAITENNNKPDFIFPDIRAYSDSGFTTEYLTMLGLKTSVKERWRQVLSEADRLPHKYLATLEPGISVKQTDQMQTRKLTLVLPSEIKATYKPEQYPAILTVGEFIKLVEDRQISSAYTPPMLVVKKPKKPKKGK